MNQIKFGHLVFIWWLNKNAKYRYETFFTISNRGRNFSSILTGKEVKP